jgi:lipoic acid synthetase
MNRHPSKPPWLRIRISGSADCPAVMTTVRRHALHTVCAEARCPNQMTCFRRGTATFLLLGPSCTRRCRFCAVDKSPVRPPDPDEPQRIGRAVREMGLDFCVLTMVTRDDLPDGGAGHVALAISAIRRKNPDIGIEVLISDLRGDVQALESVLAANPLVLNHNLETVPRLYPAVRPGADYHRSLELLARAAAGRPAIVTKSGLMLGLGERRTELLNTLEDLHRAGCRLLTLGQYLSPSEEHYPVRRYVPPEEFEEYGRIALSMGFSAVASAPLVRSSFHAGELYRRAAGPSCLPSGEVVAKDGFIGND